MDLLEGGIRVPYVVRWPARVPAGSVSSQLAITMDWPATFLEAAGASQGTGFPMDGISLVKNLKEPQSTIERDLYWRMKYREQKAMRRGPWKYLSIQGSEFLYDLSKDGRERANMAKREPGRFEALRGAYDAWHATVPPIPADAAFSVINQPSDLAQPS
jgi:arylsulfatase A-like enzyme